MPLATTGQKLKNIDRTSNFLRVTGEGQKVLVRFATDTYAYEGKHFTEYTDPTTGEKKNKAEDCPKINEGLDCEKCEKYFEVIKPNREIKAQQKAATTDEDKAKYEVQLKKNREAARPYQVKVTFYYPVLKRALTTGEQPEAVILQTSLQVRTRLEEIQKMGYDITQYDFTILCTKKLPNYYIVDRQDKERTPELSAKEKELLEEARNLDLSTILEGRKVHVEESEESENTDKKDVSEPSEEDAVETVDPDEIPF